MMHEMKLLLGFLVKFSNGGQHPDFYPANPGICSPFCKNIDDDGHVDGNGNF